MIKITCLLSLVSTLAIAFAFENAPQTPHYWVALDGIPRIKGEIAID